MTPDSVTQLTAALAQRYALERELGRGGMATVYLARDLRHDRPVALKRGSPPPPGTPQLAPASPQPAHA